MKIISFDVGIKNLAYCIIDYDNSLNILEWNIINLISDSKLCLYDNCLNKVTHFITLDNTNHYYCNIHKKEVITMINSKKDIYLSNWNINESDEIRCTKCSDPSKKKLFYKSVINDVEYKLCLTHYKNYINKINKDITIEKKVNNKVNSLSVDQ
jgi:hypothetical protein